MTDQAEQTEQNNWAAVIVASAAVIVVTLDLYGINVALPSIQSDLDASAGEASSLVVAYSLSLTALLLPFGRLADRWGRRRLMTAGLLSFGALSLACALSNTITMLLVFRFAQGGAAAAISATSLSIVSVSVSKDRRGLALSIWAAITAAGSTLGPPLAGFITGTWSWRWFLALNAPLSIIFAVALLATTKESFGEIRTRFDLKGTITFITGLTLVMASITLLSDGEGLDALTVGTALAGLLVLGLFIRIERSVESPLVELDVFSNRRYSAASIIALIGNWSYGVVILYIPIFVQDGLGYSAGEAGVLLVVFTAIYALWSPVVGALESRTTLRSLIGLGMLLLVAALVLMWIPSWQTTMVIVIALVVFALGQGLTFNPTGTIAMNDIVEAKAGFAAGLLSTTRQLGATLGLAVSSAIYGTLLSRGEDTATAAGVVFLITAALCALALLAVPLLGTRSAGDN